MLFLLLPFYTRTFIYMAAALIPAIFLLRYIYKMDTYEKEPAGLLINLLLRGVGAALLSIILETLFQKILDLSPVDSSSPEYSIITAFLVVAVVEEGTKFFLMFRTTWNDPNFNFMFDGIVYSAFTSLGFAAFENVEYVFGYGLSVAPLRAILAVPGHLGFAVVAGYFYGRARKCMDYSLEYKNRYDENAASYYKRKAVQNIIAGYLLAVLLHGFYDSCAMIGTGLATVVFIIFVIVMYIIIIRLISKSSKENSPL
ncbi:MAG: PrsW family glutamic-type intramembrane protease [Eubacterium sp.]|nr:PrsW family glutamic-type intramembrane protease [Eubacterium sp.]